MDLCCTIQLARYDATNLQNLFFPNCVPFQNQISKISQREQTPKNDYIITSQIKHKYNKQCVVVKFVCIKIQKKKFVIRKIRTIRK